MKFRYETDRLILQVLSTNQAEEVLRFWERNKSIFEPVESKRDEGFYSIEYMRKLLTAEQQMFMRMSQARYYIYLKEDPSEIIGCVHLYDIKGASQQSCFLGYKVDKEYQNHGYAVEAVEKCIDLFFHEVGLHRIEAYAMPNNAASIAVLKKLGFEEEGLLKQKFQINGLWEDHILFAKINK